MKNKTLTYLVLSLLCCMSACTSVDLCPEAEHPHITDMRVRLHWGDISKDEIPGIEKVLGTPVEFNAKGITWNRRFNMYLDKMKSGNVLDVAEVIHILQTQENEKKLSTGERRLLGNARQILVSEMMLVCGESQKDAEKWLDKFFE